MGNRLTRIYTRSGDKGTTGLAGGGRVDKDDPRIEALGAVDELNCTLGLLIAEGLPEEAGALVTALQHHLFELGGTLARPGHEEGSWGGRVEWLEQRLDRLNEPLPPLREFILPGGGRAAAQCHLARAVCRRAERRLATVSRSDPAALAPLRYLNRLSDLLFVLARHLNREAGTAEVAWRREGGAAE